MKIDQDWLSLTAGPQLDAIVADALGVERRAIDPKSIGEAVFSGFAGSHGDGKVDFYLNNNFYRHDFGPRSSKFNYGDAIGNDGYGLWLWDNRIGELWAHDIEVHVANWRRDPLPYSKDLEVAIKTLNEFSDFSVEKNTILYGKHAGETQYSAVVKVDHLSFYATGETIPLAAARVIIRSKTSALK